MAEILPLESLDVYYALSEDESMNTIYFGKPQGFFDKTQVAWSLAALLGVIKEQGLVDLRFLQSTYDNGGNHLTNVWCCTFKNFGTVSLDLYADNPIDACVAMIGKLHELKLL